jgi:hypothetical protein
VSNATRDFLDILKENNPSKIKYRFIAPETEVAEGKNWAIRCKTWVLFPSI